MGECGVECHCIGLGGLFPALHVSRRIVQRACGIEQHAALHGKRGDSVRLVLIRVRKITGPAGRVAADYAGLVEILICRLVVGGALFEELVVIFGSDIPLIVRTQYLVHIGEGSVEAEEFEVAESPHEICLADEVVAFGLGAVLDLGRFVDGHIAYAYALPCVGHLRIVGVVGVRGHVADEPGGVGAVPEFDGLGALDTGLVAHVGKFLQGHLLAVHAPVQRIMAADIEVGSSVNGVKIVLEIGILAEDLGVGQAGIRSLVEIFIETSRAAKHCHRKDKDCSYLFHIRVVLECELESKFYSTHLRVFSPNQVFLFGITFQETCES